MQFPTDKNYYKILGVSRNATAETIKKKFRKLAKQHHPDTNAGSKKSEDKFKLVSEAYEILGNETKRRAYDRFSPQDQSSARPSRGRRRRARNDKSRYGYGSGESAPRSEYREPFSQEGFQEEVSIDPNFPTRGFDLQFLVNVPLVTAALGGKVPLSYEKHVNCPHCGGIRKVVGQDCSACKGRRQIVKEVSIDVKIPPGIVDQYTLRMENKGGEGVPVGRRLAQDDRGRRRIGGAGEPFGFVRARCGGGARLPLRACLATDVQEVPRCRHARRRLGFLQGGLQWLPGPSLETSRDFTTPLCREK